MSASTHQSTVGKIYDDFEFALRLYSPTAHGVHYGLWDGSCRNRDDAILNNNRLLVQGMELEPGKRILDCGCGIGGLAIWLARTYGVAVTGISVSRRNLRTARRIAKAHELSHLVDFRYMNYESLDYPSASFDFVFHQESFCYSVHKRSVLEGVRRVLKPGGRWRAMDFFRSKPGVLHVRERQLRKSLYDWAVVGFDDVVDCLSDLGFTNETTADYSNLARRSATEMLALNYSAYWVSRLNFYWAVVRQEKRRIAIAEALTGMSFAASLLDGFYAYGLVSARV